MSPELSKPLRSKEEAFQDLLDKVQDGFGTWHDSLVHRYEASLAGAYDNIGTLYQCEAEIDRQRAEYARQTRFVDRGLTAPIWGHDKQCECLARIKLLEARRQQLRKAA